MPRGSRSKNARTKIKARSATSKARAGTTPSRRTSGDRLAEALAQLAATGEILRVISSSPTDVAPVFDAIVKSAERLCDAEFSAVARFDAGRLHLVAVNNLSPEEADAFGRLFPRPPERGFAMGRAFVDARPSHIEDALTDPDYDRQTQGGLLRVTGYRTFLAVPILRAGVPIGVIGCARRAVRPFAASQIDLVKTFAEQAVIAIENVRLFTEVQTRNRDLTESLEQQTATAEILRAISSSPTDLRPVLETVVQAAARFCSAPDVAILRLDGDVLRGAAAVGPFGRELASRSGGIEALALPLTSGSVSGRAVLQRRSIHVHDLLAEPEDELPVGRDLQRRFGHHTILATPLLREGTPLGAIVLFRTEVQPFSDRQLDLVKIFADQAVIAIENVRLFQELNARNRDLTETLEQQTATGRDPAGHLGLAHRRPARVRRRRQERGAPVRVVRFLLVPSRR